MTTATRQAIVLRDFKDEGTGEQFTASDTPVPIGEGAFLNYEAAKLVDAAPAVATVPKTRKSKPATATPSPAPVDAGDPPAGVDPTN